MAEGATNLNVPPPEGVPVVNAKSGFGLFEKWRAWFTALAEVTNWTVTEALTAGSLTLTDPAVTPAAGKMYAGDAARIVVGSGGTAPPFEGAWAQSVGRMATGFIKTPDGLVTVYLDVTGGVPGTTAFTLPAGYRPSSTTMVIPADLAGAYTRVIVAAGGLVQPLGGGASCMFSFSAEA